MALDGRRRFPPAESSDEESESQRERERERERGREPEPEPDPEPESQSASSTEREAEHSDSAGISFAGRSVGSAPPPYYSASPENGDDADSES